MASVRTNRAIRPSLVPFTPTAVPAAELARRTVGRADALDNMIEAARAGSRSANRQHTLVIAPRGGGKTHLLTLVVDRIRTDPELAKAIATVVVPEDAVEIASYADLLVTAIEQLGDRDDLDAARLLRLAGDHGELERALLGALRGRTLSLVLENLDRIFHDLGVEGQRRLRGFVETSGAVMLLASAPALFDAVSAQTEPWFGSFALERLTPWSLEEGAEFLRLVALERGQVELVDLIDSKRGIARLRAIDELVGGLPRLWTILAGCITVELLDELVPLAMQTLEELVPYYQARLNDLAPSERKLVVALCRAETLGGATNRTVAELAIAAGVPESSANKLLRRLIDSSWVTATKPPGTDQRTSWYEIREPLLRYYVAYRREAGQPLGLVVSFLRAWFSPQEIRRHLVDADAGSVSERHLIESLSGSLQPSDALYSTADPAELLAGAREWLGSPDPVHNLVRSRLAAIVAEAVALVALRDRAAAEAAIEERIGSDSKHLQLIKSALTASEQACRQAGEKLKLESARGCVQAGLDAAAESAAASRDTTLEDQVALALLAHCWRGASGDPQGASDRLRAVERTVARLDKESPALALAVQAEAAHFACATDLNPNTLARVAEILNLRVEKLGHSHPDTLTSRQNHAYWTGEAGDPGTARDLLAKLVTDNEPVLGPDHPDTLTSRHNHASWNGEAGDPGTARDLLTKLVADRERVLGADHPHTLTSRWVAGYFGRLANLSGFPRRRGRQPSSDDAPSGFGAAKVGNAGHDRQVATALVESATAESGLLDELAVAIIRAIGDRSWERDELRSWIETWAEALSGTPGAEVVLAQLDAVRREMSGDPTARPGLPPELRKLMPRAKLRD